MDKFSEMLNEFNVQKASFEKRMSEIGMSLLSEKLFKVFEENPELTQISWTGYTPYFNDGETCEYGVNEPSFCFTEEFAKSLIDTTYLKKWTNEVRKVTAEEASVLTGAEDGLDYERSLYEIRQYLSSPNNERLLQNLEDVNKFIASMGETCKIIFGDHVQITLRRGEKDFVVEGYSHD